MLWSEEDEILKIRKVVVIHLNKDLLLANFVVRLFFKGLVVGRSSVECRCCIKSLQESSFKALV